MKAITRVMMDCTNILNYLLGESSNLSNTYIICVYNIYIYIYLYACPTYGTLENDLPNSWKGLAGRVLRSLKNSQKSILPINLWRHPKTWYWRSSPSPPRMLEPKIMEVFGWCLFLFNSWNPSCLLLSSARRGDVVKMCCDMTWLNKNEHSITPLDEFEQSKQQKTGLWSNKCNVYYIHTYQ